MDLHETDQLNQHTHPKDTEGSERTNFDTLWAMSHELKISLNTILGFTQLLSYEKQITDKQNSYLQEIRNATTLLLDLQNQIQDIKQIEHDQIRLAIQHINLSSFLGDCHKIIQPEAEKSSQTFDIDKAGHGYVIADYTRLKQVILNLFRIAIKHNARNGYISVNIIQTNNAVRIGILNTGKEIAEKTEQYGTPSLISRHADYNTEDIELTLAISKKLIVLMNGSITITGSVYNDRNYILELPGKLDISYEKNSADRAPLAGTRKVNPSTDKQIIVAEDNSTSLMLILNQLEALGYKADRATNGREALHKIINNNYKLLLTDCHMPVVDGYQLAEAIRQNGNNEIAIIALTADAFPQTKVKCKKAGMDGHIIKPVDLATIRSTIEKYLPERVRDSFELELNGLDDDING